MIEPIFNTLELKPLRGIYEQNQLSHKNEIARVTHSAATRNPGSLHPDQLAILRKVMKRYPNIINSDAQSSAFRQVRSQSPKSVNVSKLPRIYWIGVGFLGVFPFHAAGHGLQDSTRNAMNYAISSYAASLTTLRYASSKPMALAASHSKFLVVTMPETPGQGSLDGVKREAEAIQKIIGGCIPVKLLEKPAIKSVLEDLPSFSAGRKSESAIVSHQIINMVMVKIWAVSFLLAERRPSPAKLKKKLFAWREILKGAPLCQEKGYNR